MLVLALDSSSNTLSVSLYETEKKQFLYQENIALKSSNLLGILVDTFARVRIRPQDLGLLLLISGPGSFTGIRTAATIAKTLAAELNIKIFAINKFELLRFIAGLGPTKPVAMPAGKNDYFVSLDDNYTDVQSNFFTLEKPVCDVIETEVLNSSSILVNYWLSHQSRQDLYFGYEQFQPYYLREPSIGKAKN